MPANILELYAACGLHAKAKGRGSRGAEWCGPCPVCSGNDRFLLWPEQYNGQGSYACRQCKIAGDTIQYCRDVHGMSFAEASKAAGKEIAPTAPRSCPAPRRAREKEAIVPMDAEQATAVWQQKATEFAMECHRHLLSTPSQLAWLAARGLPEAAVRRFLLGWNHGDKKRPYTLRSRAAWGLPPKAAKEPGGKETTALWLPRGLIIPQISPMGLVTRMRVRRPREDRAAPNPTMKFCVVDGSGKEPLYIEQSGNTLPAGTCLAVQESELDGMALAHAAGDICAVLAAGTAQIRHLPLWIYRRVQAHAVILSATDAGDANQAGAKGAQTWLKAYPQAKRWPCIHGKDAGEMYAAGVNLRSWVLAGLPAAMAAAAAKKSIASGTQGGTAPLELHPAASPARCGSPAPQSAIPGGADTQGETLPEKHPAPQAVPSVDQTLPCAHVPLEKLDCVLPDPSTPAEALYYLARCGFTPCGTPDNWILTNPHPANRIDGFTLSNWLHRFGGLVEQGIRSAYGSAYGAQQGAING